MKTLFTSIFCLFIIISCKKNEETAKNEPQPLNARDYAQFGEAFDINEKNISKEELLKFYQDSTRVDTINVVFSSKIKNVCQKKGCWMTLDLGGDADENFVKFKDYAFFVPLNAAESETIIKGKAYRMVETVESLKHYAEDAGDSKETIDAITEPEVTYYFMADGVYIKK